MENRKRISLLSLLVVGLLATACNVKPDNGSHNSSSTPIDSSSTSDVDTSSVSVATHTIRFYLDNELIKTLGDVKDGSKINPPSDSELPDGYIVNYWYVNEGSLKSPWSFSGGTVTSDLDLYADFNYETYTVKLIDKDNNGIDATVTYKQQYDFSKYYQYNENYRLQSLKDVDDNYYSIKGVWDIAYGKTLYPVWKGQIDYFFYELYEPNPTKNELYVYSTYGLTEVENNNPTSLSGDNSAITGDLENPKKDGYRFNGWWLLGDSESSGTENVDKRVNNTKINNLKEAFFGVNKAVKNHNVCGLFSRLYSISLTTDSSSGRGGTVEFVGEQIESACYKDSITVKASPIDDCVFKGWYNGTEFISDVNPYTFVMPAKDYTLSAKFFTKAEEEEEKEEANETARRKALGIDPVVSDDGKTLTYGLYPQKHVSDVKTIKMLNTLTTAESNGWYLLDGTYYAKKSASPYGGTYISTIYTFDDGEEIGKNTVYWFKCEPIEWKVFSVDDDDYSVFSSVLLDAHRFNESFLNTKNGYNANNYAGSEIRTWLNEAFFDSAFALGKDHIQTTLVDNSEADFYNCEDTLDKIYLLNRNELSSACITDAMQCCKPTDWAKASGACYNYAAGRYENNGIYWTRSPYSSNSRDTNEAWYVDTDGSCYKSHMNVAATNVCVRPAVTLAIAQQNN